MQRLRWVTAAGVAALGGLITTKLAAQPQVPFPRIHVIGSLGQAAGAGNRFADLAIAGGVRIGRVEARARLGTLGFFGGCDAFVPTKCGAGDGRYVDASVAFRLGGHPAAVAGWTASAGVGVLRTGNRAFIGGAVGRDLALGRRGVLRLELFGRHLFDRYYEETWGEQHRQAGVRVGVGLWSPVDRQ